jgi:hypothetical protein
MIQFALPTPVKVLDLVQWVKYFLASQDNPFFPLHFQFLCLVFQTGQVRAERLILFHGFLGHRFLFLLGHVPALLYNLFIE